VQVHQVVDNSALKVVLNSVDDDLLPHVHDLEVSIVVLILVPVDSLVHLLIISNAIAEILSGLFRILALIVRARCLNVADVGHDEILIVALTLDEQDLNAVARTSVHDPPAAFLGGVGSVQDADDAAMAEPGHHIRDGGLGSGATLSLTFGIVGVEEVSGWLRGIVTPIVADVESLGRD
jgi:hypothetical protein